MNLSKGYLLTLVAILAILSAMIVLPFLQFVLAAVLLAYILYPLQVRLETYISPTIAAFSLLLLAIAGFVIPFILVIIAIADDAAEIINQLDADTLQIATVEEWLEDTVGIEIDLADSLAEAGQDIGLAVLGRTTEIVGTATHLLIGIGVTLFLLYYLLKNGDDLVEWIREITPLPDDVQSDLYTEIDDVMWAVLLGHVLIAVIEGLIAGLGLFATGIPNAAFWTFVMMILSLLPLIGAFLVWGPAVGYLLMTGEPVLAVGLFVYSAIVVGISDDYLRPIVVDRYADLNPAVIILGVVGGIYAFGIMGLFFGPVILGAFKATLTVITDNYEELERADETGG